MPFPPPSPEQSAPHTHTIKITNFEGIAPSLQVQILRSLKRKLRRCGLIKLQFPQPTSCSLSKFGNSLEDICGNLISKPSGDSRLRKRVEFRAGHSSVLLCSLKRGHIPPGAAGTIKETRDPASLYNFTSKYYPHICGGRAQKVFSTKFSNLARSPGKK